MRKKRQRHQCSGCMKKGGSDKTMWYAVANDKYFCPKQECLDKYKNKIDGN